MPTGSISGSAVASQNPLETGLGNKHVNSPLVALSKSGLRVDWEPHAGDWPIRQAQYVNAVTCEPFKPFVLLAGKPERNAAPAGIHTMLIKRRLAEEVEPTGSGIGFWRLSHSHQRVAYPHRPPPSNF